MRKKFTRLCYLVILEIILCSLLCMLTRMVTSLSCHTWHPIVELWKVGHFNGRSPAALKGQKLLMRQKSHLNFYLQQHIIGIAAG